ncbi:MAG: diguanylate cyclase [Magnetococcales bacterium]|nr:diguanylate cyclase [Magnetococcales bacterium]
MEDRKMETAKLNRLGFLDGIGNRLLALIGSTFLIGTVGIALFFAHDQERMILSNHERSLTLLTHTVGSGLQTIMQSGSAEIAESYIEDIKHIKDLGNIRILRTNGVQAFTDNVTVKQVNELMGVDQFPEREIISGLTYSVSELSTLKKVVASGLSKSVTSLDNGNATMTVFYPIPNEEECTICHGSDNKVRGVLEITTSMQQAQNDIQGMRIRIVLIQITVLVLILTIVFKKISQYVVAPIEDLSSSMVAMTEGHIRQEADVEGCCEFRMMAACFNEMSEELARTYSGLQNERDKLTTIILGAREGIVVTDRSEEIVLVNPAAERLLGKNTLELRKKGFRSIIDNPEHFAAILEDDLKSVPDIVVYKGRMLQIQATTIYSNEKTMVGSAALIRDVTQEKKLENELRYLSTTDALTKLFNRRHFDSVLEEEFKRAKRYKLVLGLLLFDVDHFKKFNDTYGHDQGDRVLQAIGKVMNGHFRDIDHPCRYGGEEFCAVLPSTGLEGVQNVAERLREKISDMRVDGLQVHISIGVSIFPNSGAKSPDELLKMADEALYQAKEQGRNRVCIAPSKV